MMKRIVLGFLLLIFGILNDIPVMAQDWSSVCGSEPKAPLVNSSDYTSYNKSVQNFNAYNKAIRVYYGCVANYAHEQQTKIAKKAQADMNALQKASADTRARITAILEKLQHTLKSGRKKLILTKNQYGFANFV